MRRRSLVLGLVAVLAILSPCASGAQDRPRSGGVLTWYVYGDPGRLDIHLESPLSVQQAVAGIYSGLLHRDPDDPAKITGDLAERWTVSPDGKVYTFHLRPGLQWADGTPLTNDNGGKFAQDHEPGATSPHGRGWPPARDGVF